MAAISSTQKFLARCSRTSISIPRRTLSSTSSGGSDEKKGDVKDAPKPSNVSERADEARGALKNFMRSAAQNTGASEGLWAKLRRASSPQSSQQQRAPRARPDGDAGGKGEATEGDRSARPAGGVEATASSRGGDQVEGDVRPRRSMNPRTFQKRRPAFGAEQGGGGGAPGGGIGGGGAPRRGKSRRSREGGPGEGSQRGGSESIPPAIRAVLSEDFFKEQALRGYTIDTRNMDEWDGFLANIYMEALKTESSDVRVIVESPALRRNILPKPRPTKELMATFVPPIRDALPDSDGHRIAADAWQTISRNYFYNDREKDYLCNGIARRANKILAAAELVSKVDMICMTGFRKGLEGIEEEKRKLMLAQDQATGDDMIQKDDTNWDVEAVVDEDDL